MRRRNNQNEELQEQYDIGVAEYKCLPLVEASTDYPPLFSDSCHKCCPSSSSYIVDPVSKILGTEIVHWVRIKIKQWKLKVKALVPCIETWHLYNKVNNVVIE